MGYILYVAIMVNLGFSTGSFVGHSDKVFKTYNECKAAELQVLEKANDKLKGLIKSWESKCIEYRGKVDYKDL